MSGRGPGRRFLVALIVSTAAALSVLPAAAGAASPEVAYVTTLNSGVFAYAIDSAGGTLTPLQNSPFPAGNGGFGVTATPDRSHLYVSNYGDGTLSAFDVASGGALSPVGGPLSATPHPVFSAPTPNGGCTPAATIAGC